MEADVATPPTNTDTAPFGERFVSLREEEGPRAAMPD